MSTHNDDLVADRRVENPHTTYAQFRADVMAGKGDAGVQRTQVNLVTAMGGFVRFYGTEAQCRAVAAYRAIFEAAQLGGARAVDPGREPVDGGGANPEAVFINGADARKKLSAIDDFLKSTDVKRLRFVVIGEWGPTPYAKWRYGVRTPNSKHVSDAKAEIRRIADRLAAFLNLTARVPQNNAGIRVEAELPNVYDPTLVSTRKVTLDAA
jgi:hypothetical protein